MIRSLALELIAGANVGASAAVAAIHADIAAKPLTGTSGGHMSHDAVAVTVRMLHRSDLAHEAVCTIARDRIVWLAARLAEAEQWIAAVRKGCADNGVAIVDQAVDGAGNVSGPWVVNERAHDAEAARMWMDPAKMQERLIGFTSAGNIANLVDGFATAIHPQQTAGHTIPVYTKGEPA